MSLARAGRILESVTEDCAVALRLGATWSDRWRLASALVGWRHAGRLPLLNGRGVTNQPLQLKAFGRRFAVSLAAGAAKNEMLIFHEIFGQHVYEMGLPFEPRVVLDLGSFTGLSPLFFALRHPDAAIYCVEPDPDNYAALCHHTADFPAVRRLNCAVAGQAEQRTFYLSSTQTCGHSLYPPEASARTVTVTCVTVNDLIEQFNLPHIDILKFDIEGAETEIFEDFPFRVPVHSLVGELHCPRDEEPAFARKFADLGYTVRLERDEFLALTMFRAVRNS